MNLNYGFLELKGALGDTDLFSDWLRCSLIFLVVSSVFVLVDNLNKQSLERDPRMLEPSSMLA